MVDEKPKNTVQKLFLQRVSKPIIQFTNKCLIQACTSLFISTICGMGGTVDETPTYYALDTKYAYLDLSC